MFITLWFGFDYGTNPPLGTLIINKFIFVHAFGSVVFMQENMDIKDEFKKVQWSNRSLVRVNELDEITSNGEKDLSVTKEHPRGLKHKRPKFMHGKPPSWTRG
jgi:hypothetical protein